jgi:hypothetical protein
MRSARNFVPRRWRQPTDNGRGCACGPHLGRLPPILVGENVRRVAVLQKVISGYRRARRAQPSDSGSDPGLIIPAQRYLCKQRASALHRTRKLTTAGLETSGFLAFHAALPSLRARARASEGCLFRVYRP